MPDSNSDIRKIALEVLATDRRTSSVDDLQIALVNQLEDQNSAQKVSTQELRLHNDLLTQNLALLERQYERNAEYNDEIVSSKKVARKIAIVELCCFNAVFFSAVLGTILCAFFVENNIDLHYSLMVSGVAIGIPFIGIIVCICLLMSGKIDDEPMDLMEKLRDLRNIGGK